MRLIGNLAEQKQAESFVAFLTTLEIQTHVEEENEDFEIWIKDEDNISQAVTELESYKANPENPKYVDAISKAKALQNRQLRKRKQIAKNVVNVSGTLGRRSQPLTIVLIVICGLVYILTSFGAKESRDKATFRALAFNAVPPSASSQILDQNNDNIDAWPVRLASVVGGEVWRLITPIFLHFDIFHLVFNMYWLFVIGGQIENRYGSFWFGVLIILAAAISNFVQCIVPVTIGGSAPFLDGGYLINAFGGMSGVVYALFGFVWMRMTYDRASGLFLPQTTIFLLLGWLVFCMTPVSQEILQGNVANWAHAIGLLVGVIAGYWPMLLPQRLAGG